MSEILTESFCERCGTRYTFESARPKARLKGVRVLSRGLRNFVLSDDTSMDEAMAAARNEADRESTSHQLDAFHKTFKFCMSCRQYTCPDCWNETEARCQSCAPLSEIDLTATHDDSPRPFQEMLIGAEPRAVAEPELNGTNGHVAEVDDADPAPEIGERLRAFFAEPQVSTEAPLDREPRLKASDQTAGLLRRFRPGQSLDDELDAFERRRSAPGVAPDEASTAVDAEATIEAEAAVAPEAALEAEAAIEPALDDAGAKTLATVESEVDAPDVEPSLIAEAPAADAAEVAASSEAVAEDAAPETPGAEPPRAIAAGAHPGEPAALDAFTPFEPFEPFDPFEPAELAAGPADVTAEREAEAPEAAAVAAKAEASVHAEAPVQAEAPVEPEAAALVEPEAPVEPEAQVIADVTVSADAPAPEPAAATPAADVVEQPTWRIEAPDVAPTGPAGPAGDDEFAPAPPAPSAEPQWPLRPEWPAAPQASAGLPFLGRPAQPEGGVESLWAASNRELVATPPAPGRSPTGIRPCLSCGLSLSASARFCRRCGTPQAG